MFQARFADLNLRCDLFGGVTTAIISLPLALAFGVASGAGAEAGLWGAILVGFFCRLIWRLLHSDFRANRADDGDHDGDFNRHGGTLP